MCCIQHTLHVWPVAAGHACKLRQHATRQMVSLMQCPARGKAAAHSGARESVTCRREGGHNRRTAPTGAAPVEVLIPRGQGWPPQDASCTAECAVGCRCAPHCAQLCSLAASPPAGAAAKRPCALLVACTWHLRRKQEVCIIRQGAALD